MKFISIGIMMVDVPNPAIIAITLATKVRVVMKIIAGSMEYAYISLIG